LEEGLAVIFSEQNFHENFRQSAGLLVDNLPNYRIPRDLVRTALSGGGSIKHFREKTGGKLSDPLVVTSEFLFQEFPAIGREGTQRLAVHGKMFRGGPPLFD
jgi:hypothetical protein